MQEALGILTRQLLLVAGTYLVATGKIDQSLVEPMIGAGMALFSVSWLVYKRFIKSVTK